MKNYIKSALSFYPLLYRLFMFVAVPVIELLVMGYTWLMNGLKFGGELFAIVVLPVMVYYLSEAWTDGLIFGNFSGGNKAFYFNYYLSSKRGIKVLKDALKGDCFRRAFMSLFVTVLLIPEVIGTFYQKKNVEIVFYTMEIKPFYRTMTFCVLFTVVIALAIFAVLTLVIWVSRFFALIWFGMMFASMGTMLVGGICILALENVFVALVVLLVMAVGLNHLFQKSVVRKGERCYYDE